MQSFTFRRNLFSPPHFLSQLRLPELRHAMRVSFVLVTSLLFTGNLLMASAGHAQSLEEQKVTILLNNESLKKAFRKIERQSEFKFAFVESQIAGYDKLFLTAERRSLAATLELLLKRTHLKYFLNGKTIVVVNKEKEEQPAGNWRGTAEAPAVIIKGTVMNDKNEPLVGASVVIKGTTIGTTTGEDGSFKLESSGNSGAIIVSFTGYTTQELSFSGESSLKVKLLPLVKVVDEVVVIGYGTSTRKDLTTAISTIKPKDFVQGAVSPLLSIQGKIPGLNVVSDNGTDPNAGITLQLRGINSINASQGPLVVIDGVPGGDLRTVVKEDIESIDVLRDASAAAIYGTRASGGVILITTKKAKAGQLNVTFTTELFMETLRKRPEVLSAAEYLEHQRGDDLGHSTDWYEQVTNKNPFSQRYVLNLNGGQENARISATLNARNANGMAIGSDRQEIGGRVNTYFKILDGLLELTSNISYQQTKRNRTDNNIFNMAMLLNPTDTPFDPADVTGYKIPTGGYDYFNPLAEVKLRKDAVQSKTLLANARLKLNITKSLSSSAMFAINSNNDYERYYRSSQHRISRANNVAGYASQKYGQSSNRTFEWTGNYRKSFLNAHTVDAVVGYTYQDFNGEGFDANNSDFSVDGLGENDLGNGRFLKDGRAGMGSYKNPTVKLAAFFGRVSYNYLDRYLVTASVRREGSSKFAKENRWGTFPGVSVAWRISQESFLKNSRFLSDLKLRGGYGETGNEGFGSETAFRMYSPDTWWLVNGQWVTTYGVRHNQNANIKWEVKKELNVGLDFGLFDNRITGSFDIYNRKVKDLLYAISVSQPPAIYENTIMNVGSMENKGFEGSITGVIVSNKNWDYSSTIVFSHNKSYLTTLYGSNSFIDRKSLPGPGSPGNAVRLYPGEEIGRFFIWRSAGFTEEGNWMLYDKSGKPFDVSKQPKKQEDKSFVGNAVPRLILSWNHTVRYKNFDAGVYMRSWLGYDVFNMINMYYGIASVKNINVLKDSYQKYSHIKGEKELSDFWLEKGNFLKLDALTLGYTFTKDMIKPFQGLRVYATGRDLFVITKYSGLDPEVNINGLEPGFEELNVYPKTRTFMVGVQVNF